MHGGRLEPGDVSRALSAATLAASDLGLLAHDGTVLQNANRIAVRLSPCDVLARVTANTGRNGEVAAFELDIARQFNEDESPVAVVEPRVAPRVYVRDGFAITFWRFYAPLPASDISPAEYASALEQLHVGMRDIDVTAPHFTARVVEAQSIVGDLSRSPTLRQVDRELLLGALDDLRRAIVDRRTPQQLLHGEPHPGNLLKTESGMRFIDFETCCYGPVEFDLAHAPEEVGQHYAGADRSLLRDCRILSQALVAAWRSDANDQFPNGTEMREELIQSVRNGLTSRRLDRSSQE